MNVIYCTSGFACFSSKQYFNPCDTFLHEQIKLVHIFTLLHGKYVAMIFYAICTETIQIEVQKFTSYVADNVTADATAFTMVKESPDSPF